MNVSMQDTYNLTWKIAAVVKGYAKRSILKTYQSERRKIAQDLIAFDHKFSRLFSGRPARDAADEAGISMEEFKDVFLKGAMFASGLSVDYGPSMLVAKRGDPVAIEDDPKGMGESRVIGKQELADNIRLGMRFPSAQVLNQADARPWEFAHFLKSDGRFRIVLFAGNLTNRIQWERVTKFGSELAHPDSFIGRFTPSDKKVDSLIEVLTIHSSERKSIELLSLPGILHPFDEETGWDYDKVFVDDLSYHEGHGEAYKQYGVDQEKGCVVIVRPDQYVGWLGELESIGEMDRFFSKILIPQK